MKWLVFFAVLLALCVLWDKWFFEMVMAADWPGWVKYMILR